MAILKNQRHETFAALIAAGKSATDAYVSAGFSAGRDGDTKRGAAQSASRLRRSPRVSARIAELLSEVQQSRSNKAWLDR
jgi:hypothetical protein